MGCDCGKPKCDGHCGVSPAVLQINNPSECVLFHRVEVPASMGDSKTNPPKSGAYKNVLLYYEADQTSWLYSSDGIPQKLVNGLTDYEAAINLPQINGVTLLGNKSLDDLGITDAIDDAVDGAIAMEKTEREASDDDLQDQIDDLIDTKQDKLTAGDNIAISGNTISAIVPTKTSDLANDGATCASVYIEESDITPSELSGEGEFITLDGTTDCSALDIQLNGNATQATLPSGYNAVEYIEASSTQYFDTGVQLGANDFSIEMGVMPTVSASYEQPFLSIWTSTHDYWNWFKTNGNNLDLYARGHHIINDGATTGTYHDLKLSRNGNAWEQVSNSATSSWTFSPTSVNNTTLKVFNRGDSNGKANARLYYLRISVAGELVRNYIPCYRESDNAVGVYDTVHRTFTPSATSDSFIAGAESTSPSPTCPQPISVVTGENVVKVVGKNLFDKDGVTILNAYISGANVITAQPQNRTAIVPLQPNTTYTLSGTRSKIPDTATDDFIALLVSSSTEPAIGSSGRRVGVTTDLNMNFTFTTDLTENWLALKVANTANSNFDETMATIQLELGNSASSFEPYTAQDYTISLGELELAGVGEIQPDGLPKYHDQIKNNPTTGKWYIRRNIGKKVCDGSENWVKSSTYQGNYYLVGALGTNAVAMSRDYMANLTNIFVRYSSELTSSDNCIYVETGGAQGRNLNFKVSSKETLQDFKDFLSATPLVFYYPLVTPVDEEITNQTLIDQLEALAGAHGYDGVTNIMSTSPGLPAILSVSTYTDSVIPSATRTRAGIVRIGDGIDVDDCGTISAKQPTAFTMQYTEGLGDWQSGNIYELVKKTAGSQTEHIYRADRHYYSGTGVSFLNEKTGVTLSPQELYALLLTGEDVVINHVPLGWAVDNGGEDQYAGNYIDGIRLKRETIASQSGNVVSFNGSAFVTTYIPRSSSYEEVVQDTLGIAISGYEDDGAMVYNLVSIDGFSLYGSLQ